MLLAAGLLAAAATAARPAAVATLIAEKAAAEAGAGLPEGGRFEVSLETPEPTEAQLVSAFAIDPSTGRFAANVVTDAGTLRRVYGLAILTVPVPVPTRRILPGEVLSRDDFRTVELPYARLGAFSVTSLDRLEGQQVRQTLAEGRPVQEQAVSPPQVIGRGARVSIRFTSGGMTLTAPGRAITAAEADQVVRVVNLASDRTITGIARPGGIVEVDR